MAPLSENSYSPAEITAILLDFYLFLTTLHYDAQYLKLPPAEGWPGMESLLKSLGSSEMVGQVMKRIPYFDNDCKAFIHYKSRPVDYPTLPKDCFERVMWGRVSGSDEIYSERRQITIDMRDVFPLATGREAWGKYIWLNVRDGEITVEERLMHDLPQVDLKVFFDGLKQDYITLKLIPCRGRITIEADKIKERPGGEIITEEEVIAQEEAWGTALDIQYIRQLYRGFGWPLAFRRDEAFDAVDQLMDKLAEHRDEWEPTEEDWDDDDHWC
ncbi:hypothetical protein FOQG_13587 [Fusarium oxysporum f. sp. raphani 54005]|uniref:Uncharacterized protein n=2 Tax=Fusarium oxysporum f. sp. raphani TaxID=96318 RepID=X0BJP4_FUSOX|nr:hypothetical protein FOQG_13587 [Fusarium oxysporum f. sp. raphani 54005]KAG7429710.1 hypothetical protein Forpi1262_v008376 [Fusarium oxysporum f. sp. raphani]KAJ4037384.1 hypothetical protein NW763_013544 [Fusarium oxysporum]WKT48178.1 hypothetical protein QSH57_013083 [Fusarium oxysporum f. sp. vasinfectum]KAJ4041372.1 hypothetical protein NW753_010783 [Fusarium oxysporum]